MTLPPHLRDEPWLDAATHFKERDSPTVSTASFPIVFTAIENLQREMETLWAKAAANDNLNPATKFAVFSEQNEQAGRFEKASQLIAEALRVTTSPESLTSSEETNHLFRLYSFEEESSIYRMSQGRA